MILNIVAATLGVILVWGALRDVFKAAIVPREVSPYLRPSAMLTAGLWRLWSWRASYVRDPDRREDSLSTFAPFNIIALLVLWVVLLCVGYGLIFWAIRNQLSPQPISLTSAFYFAGTSFLTIGFGDIVGRQGLARLVSVIAGASGLGVVAIVTSYFFSLIGSFQRRESFVVTLGARAGSPPSGIQLLAIAGYADMRSSLASIFRDGQTWCATLMESHLAYPVLGYFRSSHDDESWISALGTLLDAAALVISSVDDPTSGEAKIMYELGRHALHDLSKHYRQVCTDCVGIGRDEFDAALHQLAQAHYPLHRADAAWPIFAKLRMSYAGQLIALARHFRIPPMQWISDRSLLAPRHDEFDAGGGLESVGGIDMMQPSSSAVDRNRETD